MAIQDTKTNYYYKINFDESIIKGNIIIPRIEIYKTREEREREKEFTPKIDSSLLNIRDDSEKYYAELMERMSKYDLTNPEIYTEEDGLTIRKDLYPNEYEIQRKHLQLEKIFNTLTQPLLLKRSESAPAPPNNLDDKDYEILKAYGIEKEWIENPITIIDAGEYSIGNYKIGDEITLEYYYEKLKPRLENEYKNV